MLISASILIQGILIVVAACAHQMRTMPLCQNHSYMHDCSHAQMYPLTRASVSQNNVVDHKHMGLRASMPKPRITLMIECIRFQHACPNQTDVHKSHVLVQLAVANGPQRKKKEAHSRSGSACFYITLRMDARWTSFNNLGYLEPWP